MSEIPFEDEGVVRTDEQAGTAQQTISRVEREYDVAHPPVAGNDPKETVDPLLDKQRSTHEQAQLREDEQGGAKGAGTDVKRAYPTAADNV